MQENRDFAAPAMNGFIALLWWIVLIALVFVAPVFLKVPLAIFAFIFLTGFTVIAPNSSKVITFFGKYKGTLSKDGFYCTLPLSGSQKVLRRYINFNTQQLKVNDAAGNPIEIAAVVVWRVIDPAKAVFDVDDYRQFIANQSEIAVRNIAAKYPYDGDGVPSLRDNADDIARILVEDLQTKLKIAGIHVEEVRISHLAYAAEIAAVMLKRQQAVAVLQARRYLVENALAIVDDVLTHYAKDAPLNVSDDKKLSFINNMLVTLVADRESQPVLSVGG
jgi:regulator of protease activity HflC (stomatin/prohibitin superfamily)